MKVTLIFILTNLLFSCSQKTELEYVVEKTPELSVFIDSLKTTAFIYKKCEACNLIGLTEHKLIGYTDRYPPKGYYDKKEIKMGLFEYDTYLILDSENDERINGKIYFCYFNKEQKLKFENFNHYYENLIKHGKSDPSVRYVGNIAIIKIVYGG